MITLRITAVATAILQSTAQQVQISMLGRSTDAPMATSGDNVYVTWWTNKTPGNNEVMFRSSTDNGAIFVKTKQT
jgi:hypothetical protein